MISRYDLHCHTTASDGTLSPNELIELALNLKLSGLSITDHDTIEAYETALEIAKERNLPLVTGVEFSATHRNESVHILAYGFHTEDPSIQNFCKRHKERREDRFQQMIDRLASQGIPLDVSQIEYKGIPGRPHLAGALLKQGYVTSLKEAFDRFLGEGRPCFIHAQAPDIIETLKIIKEANAYAIIAHPQLIKNNQILLDLLKMDFDGLEVYYANFLKSQAERWLKIGQRKNWLLTGGSDFHGENKPSIMLGASFAPVETFTKLMERTLENEKRL